jgi:hypothetical protein
MSKKPLSEREELLSKGSPTFEHRDETGRPPEAIYAGDGHDRMDADIIARANHGKDESKSSTPIK